MPTFPRGYINHATNAANAALLETLCRQADQPITQAKPARYTYTPGDEITLRGIPAIGRGVQGAIPHTSPHAHTS